jgi:hypothetical protein
VYLQARYLHPPSNRGKYDNPTARLASNPRLTLVEPRSNGPDGLTLVTEGIPDALAAATGGYSAYALLGASAPDRRVAERLALRPGLVVIAFDADEAGRAGERRLVELMKQLDRAVLAIEPPMVDLNSWLVARGRDDFTRQLGLTNSLTSRGSRLGAARSIA